MVLDRDKQYIVLCDKCGDHAKTFVTMDSPFATSVSNRFHQ